MASRSADCWKRRAFSCGRNRVAPPSAVAIGLQPFEDFLGVVQDGGGRIHRDRRARLDPRIVPALGLADSGWSPCGR